MLNGTQMFISPLHVGNSQKEFQALPATVHVSIWKHFNGSSDAILTGDADLIEGLYHQRRLFDGTLPKARPKMVSAADYGGSQVTDYAKVCKSDEAIHLGRDLQNP